MYLSNLLLAAAVAIANHGYWLVQKSTDEMTDKVVCVAHYAKWRAGKPYLRMDKDAFYVVFRVLDAVNLGGTRGMSTYERSLLGGAGLKAYMVRFDDRPATAYVLASQIEQRRETIILEGNQLAELVSSKRVKIRAMTMLDTVLEDDVEVDGISQAFAVLQGPQCK